MEDQQVGTAGRAVGGITALCVAACVALLGIGRVEPAAARPSGPEGPAALRPILECVAQDEGGGGYTAHFGYLNEGVTTVTLPVGRANHLFPGSADRSQPTSFTPGRTPRHPRATLIVAFDGRDLPTASPARPPPPPRAGGAARPPTWVRPDSVSRNRLRGPSCPTARSVSALPSRRERRLTSRPSG